MRKEAPIAFVPQLGCTLFTRRDDIFVAEKHIDVFSSHQPQGLMNKLMGHNMMRKDGDAHMAERTAIFPAVSPNTVSDTGPRNFRPMPTASSTGWRRRHRRSLPAFALPFSAECLKDITGLTNMRFQDMDAWSQAMIDGIANYTGNKEVEARCHAATVGIDAAIDDMMPVVRKNPNTRLLSVMLAAGQPMESVRANIKLAISGGQNEPRDAIAGTVWALLTHPDQLALVRDGKANGSTCSRNMRAGSRRSGCRRAGSQSRGRYRRRRFRAGRPRVPHVRLRQPRRGILQNPIVSTSRRDIQKSIAFGAGPHFCAGALASRGMVADVALPAFFRG